MEPVDLDRLDVRGDALEPATEAELAAAEQAVGALPSGYADIVTRFGFCAIGHLVRVYPPSALGWLATEWRERVMEYWFWDLSAVGLDKETVRQGWSPADTFNGDEIVVVPGRADLLLLLPRDEDVAHALDPDLRVAVAQVLDWVGEEPATRVETFSGRGLRRSS